ncbi:hypothetical protein [Streptomyces decoyicus]
MRHYSDELEADLQEFFQVDLRDFWRGRLTLRQIGVYIKSLLKKQGRSTLLMALDPSAEWSHEAFLGARISDGIEASNYYFLSANLSEEGREELESPKPIPRPGQPEEEQGPQHDFATGEEVTSFFAQMGGL